jgi:cystathionine gamma-synthase
MSSPSKPPNSTRAVHAGRPPERPSHTLTPSIVQTATYTFENTAVLERYMRGEDPDPDREEYARYGNPTVRELEQRVTALEGAEDGVAFGSGMAAITTAILALVKAGEHIVLFNDCYRRTRQLVRQVLSRFGIEHDVVPAGDLKALEAALRPNTRLVISESPTNPFLYCVDLAKLVQVVKGHGRIRTLVDSTMATPINCRPLEYGVDLVIHSATKYLSGHNDVLGGVAVGAAHLVSLLRDLRGVVGTVLDPHGAFLILRGLKTLGLRVERQNETALAVARALEAHPGVERVYYPLLESHPSFAVARTQMSGGGGMVSFVVKGGRAAASRVVDACRLALIAPSFGGPETLIEQPAIMSYSELSEEELERLGISPALVRLALGVEETADLVDDLLQALRQA